MSKIAYSFSSYIKQYFIQHYNAFEVSQNQQFLSCVPNILVEYHPFLLYPLFEAKIVIPLEYHFIEDL